MGIDIALIGNPGCGLTTLFNQMTGGSVHTGHFSTPGNKTKEGPVKNHKDVNVIELPGTYSLSAYSIDDVATREILLRGKPDVIVNVIDATGFERNLYLTLQLMELELPMVLALNMMDEMENNQIDIDLQKLSQELTIPVIPIAASKNRGTHDLIHYALQAAREHHVPQKIDFCSGHVHTAIHTVSHLIAEDAKKAELPLRFCCTKIVEGDEPTLEALRLGDPELDIIDHLIEDMQNHLGTDRESAMADMRYAFIEKLCKKVLSRPVQSTKEHARSVRMDRILTHRIFAIPIFLCIMLLVFYFTFGSLGTWLSDLLSAGIDKCVEAISYALLGAGVNPAFHSLVIDGICAGVGSVLSFLPIIAVLFFFLSILEDSGYMPRVAFVMDKLLRKLGLSGRSIVPMLIGFGCSVPAIMATRSLPSKRDRSLTMALIPFMSCSAKLPIYAMFTAAFFTDHKALVMIGLYVTGIIVAIVCALAFKGTLFRGDPVPFVLVLPPYRIPAMKSVALRMWENVKGFIKKAFTVIFVATIVIWFLQSFDTGFNMVSSSDTSILADIGKIAAPIFAPLGFGDWRAATALITGMSAKEAVVSTLAVLTGAADGASLSAMLTQVFTPLSAFAFLVFCLLYMPCVATLATIRREMGGWRYAFGVMLFQCVVAWIVSFIVFHVGGLFL
ncbi:ferrous iron transport protein B [Anaerovorax odorimutans]|uniref:Ferrous iron transport protein B n=1 Tax=Anaerovorax odorimutans TaxID=109327 RepID=A0ABT1RS42_9FIRM|nr:ferrous iron transport protein B [Anaerovorax odorimutans]MCQ4638029.1 ferrous iron transport protein B [Anaerovorax odorimutans]